jgi:Raf kinase inhibitor-like YbhB/YbcL family protein
VLAFAGCGGSDRVEPAPAQAAPDEITLASTEFRDGAMIPKVYSCDGDDISPPLSWAGVPEGTRELALLMEDPDAPGGTFVHWVLFKIPVDQEELADAQRPLGGREAKNSRGEAGYAGPCPPEGDAPHHYEFIIYALSKPIDLPNGASGDDVRAAIDKDAIARGELVGRFGR